MAKTWDGYDAYLFDIDGTLLRCTDPTHYFAFCDALEFIAGRPLNLDGVIAHGNTDVGILRDAFRLAGIDEGVWRMRTEELTERMCHFVEGRRSELRADVLPMVPQVLQHLRLRGAVLGVATGNLEGIGRLKLERGNLLAAFDFGGYSNGFEFRQDVFSAALSRASCLTKAGFTACVVGDTPEDVRAARAIGLDVIAVATGSYTFEELASTGPTWCVQDLGKLLCP